MFKYFVAVLFLSASLKVWAAPRCSGLFVLASKNSSAAEILNSINDKYSHKLFNKSVDENIQQSSVLARSYSLFKLKRMFRNLEKNGRGFNNYELASFVYKLDQLAFADAIDKKLSYGEKSILSEARRSLVNEGLIKHFALNNPKSGFFKKFSYYFSQSISWKYWRWSVAWVAMPKLLGVSLPPELAHKILLEGLNAHRSEVEKYLPQINSRAYFNTFSKVYNTALVTALFTVVPYLIHDFYQEQMLLGIEQARLLFEPLLNTTHEMSQVDQLLQKEIGALEKYNEAYQLKYGVWPTPEQIEAAKEAIAAAIKEAIKIKNTA